MASDSLWFRKPGASPKEIAEFCREVSAAVNVPLATEGKYRWIVFLPSKILENVPVLNRYYGVFENGKVKTRGVEARRQDTPHFVYRAQTDMIKKLAEAHDLKSFRDKILEALRILGRYADKLINNDLDTHELLITKRLSKTPSSYNHDVFQAVAAKQLEGAGFEMHAGQTVQYLIVNARSRNANERVKAAQLLRSNIHHDMKNILTCYFLRAKPCSHRSDTLKNESKPKLCSTKSKYCSTEISASHTEFLFLPINYCIGFKKDLK